MLFPRPSIHHRVDLEDSFRLLTFYTLFAAHEEFVIGPYYWGQELKLGPKDWVEECDNAFLTIPNQRSLIEHQVLTQSLKRVY